MLVSIADERHIAGADRGFYGRFVRQGDVFEAVLGIVAAHAVVRLKRLERLAVSWKSYDCRPGRRTDAGDKRYRQQ